jgi:hypothetical protein
VGGTTGEGGEVSYEKQLREIGSNLPVGLYQAVVLHDPDCPKLYGMECKCQPDIEIINVPWK